MRMSKRLCCIGWTLDGEAEHLVEMAYPFGRTPNTEEARYWKRKHGASELNKSC